MFPEQPFRNAPFSVFVETRDIKGRIQNVPRSTTIRLTLQAGNGHLFGNLAGVLHAGANRLRISDVIYDLAEDSVRLIASVHSGTPLENDTSAFFSMRVGTLPSEPILHYPADQQIMQTDTVLCRWTKSNPDARSYWIELSTDSSFTNARVDSAATDTIAVVRSLLDNKTYWWRVKAKNLAGWGLMSQPRRFRTNIPPARPIGCSDAGVSDATLFWKRGEEDMDKYYIYCDTTSSPMILVDSTLHRNDTTKTFRGLSSGIRYFFRIVAIDSAGNRSLLSPDVTARPGLFGAMQSALWNSLDDDVAVWGDYDGDDDLDLLTMGARDTMRHAYLHRNDGDGRFSRSQLQLPLLYAPQVNCYDYNNDGMLDMLMTGTRFQMAFFHSMKIVRNLGNNVFAEVNTTFPEAEGPGVGLFDYNNDGREDIAISSSNVFGTASTVVYRNCGGGEYTRTKLLGLGLPGGWNASVLPFDCDQDCDADVLLAGYGASYFTKLFRNGGAFNDSIWIFSEIASSFKNFSSQHIAAADYDNDGDLDFVINGNPPGLALYRNNGGGSFTLDSSCGLPPLRNEIAWGDYDNDGDVDLLVSGTSITAYGFRVYHNNGDRTFSLAYSHPNDDSTGSCTFADYDRDGDLDVLSVASHVARRTTVVYKNLTSNLNTPPSPPTNLTATVTSNTVRLSWHRGTDAQTPSPGLSYNVRVGTTREGCEIKSSGSSPLTGFRRLPRSGNVYQDTSWLIRELAPGKYYWSVQSIDNAFAGSVFAPTDSFEVIVATTPINKQLPSEIGLHQNHPNPFNPSTTINVNVPSQANLALKIYDVLGKEVKSFEYENVPAGTHQVVWDGKNQGGAQVASGVYFYRLNAGTTVLTKQMLLLK